MLTASVSFRSRRFQSTEAGGPFARQPDAGRRIHNRKFLVRGLAAGLRTVGQRSYVGEFGELGYVGTPRDASAPLRAAVHGSFILTQTRESRPPCVRLDK